MAVRALQSRFNVIKFNDGHFNGGPLSETFSTDLFVFEGYSLHNGSTIHISALNDSGPSRELLGGSVPRGHGEFLNADYWRRKYIEVSGHLTASSATALEALMDTVRKNLRFSEGELDITRNSVVRRYIATLVNMDSLFPTRQHYHTTWIPFNARFECRTPFAQDRAYSYITQSITTSPTNITGATNTGTEEAEPVITVVMDAASSVTVFNIKRINPATGATLDEIEYSGTLAAGDIFVFDSETKTVKKNGTEVDYTGAFPILEVGGNVLKFTVTGTSFTAYTTVKHKNRFL